MMARVGAFGGAGGAVAAVREDRDRPPRRRDVHSALERCISHSRMTVGTVMSQDMGDSSVSGHR